MFTWKEFMGLSQEHREAVSGCYDAICGGPLDFGTRTPDPAEEEEVDDQFALLAPCEGCVPEDYISDSLEDAIIRKFRVVYWAAIGLCCKEMDDAGLNPCLVVEPSYGASYITIVDDKARLCFLLDLRKAANFHFPKLKDLAEEILDIRGRILETADRHRSEE